MGLLLFQQACLLLEYAFGAAAEEVQVVRMMLAAAAEVSLSKHYL